MHIYKRQGSSLAAISLCIAWLPTSLMAAPGAQHYPQSFHQCTEANTLVHKEWSAMGTAERIHFTDSVQCLLKSPPKTPKSWAPGVTSRYDDFTAAHINNTLLIHGNGVFLAWHRHFLHLFQRALTEECGYRGALPYWNWVWWADDLAGSPIFDGSKTSIGGDGCWNASAPVIRNGNYTFPRGHGGGCIEEGPFANISTGFRVFKNEEILQSTMPKNALHYAPHCVTRDLNNAISGPNHKQGIIKKLLAAPNIQAFQGILDLSIRNTTALSPHSAGHWSVGISMMDQFASPSDPAFYLHHSMIDNLWYQWQRQDIARRGFALDGTVTTLNNPPSQNATLDFVTQFGYVGPPRRLGEIMGNYDGKYCHRYEYDENAAKPNLQ